MLSIAIPTAGSRNLEPVLTALCEQQDRDFELLVVENGTRRRNLAPQLAPFAARLDLTHLYLAEAGLNRARNVAVQHAGHDIVALLDDDCVADPGWVTAVKNHHARYPKAGVIGGRVWLELESGQTPYWLRGEFRRSLAAVDWGEESGPLKPWKHLVGANLSFRRAVFDRVGGFRQDIGLRGGDAVIRANDEAEFVQHAAVLGEPGAVYAPGMAVRHRIPRQRITFDYMLRRRFGQGVSDVEQELATMGKAAALWRFHGMVNRGQWHRDEHLAISETLDADLRPEFLLRSQMARFCYLAGARWRLTDNEPDFPGNEPEGENEQRAFRRGRGIAERLHGDGDSTRHLAVTGDYLYRDWGSVNPLHVFAFLSGLVSPLIRRVMTDDGIPG